MFDNQPRDIYGFFYTFKRTKEVLQNGWTNAQGVIVEGIKVKSIEKVTIVKPNGTFYNCVHVIYVSATSGKRCSQFISCRAYLKAATDKRKAEGKEKYKASQEFSNPTNFRVSKINAEFNEVNKIRTVTVSPQAIICNCEDFNNQASYLSQHPYLWEQVMKKRKICKHCYSVLSHLGCSSLNEYLKSWKPGGSLNHLANLLNKTSRARSA